MSSKCKRFQYKLWALVNGPHDSIIWHPKGESILVNFSKFKEILNGNDFCKSSNKASFIRQLNLYGFKTVINIEDCRDRDIKEYCNSNFKRGHFNLLTKITRNGDHVANKTTRRRRIKKEVISDDESDYEPRQSRRRRTDFWNTKIKEEIPDDTYEDSEISKTVKNKQSAVTSPSKAPVTANSRTAILSPEQYQLLEDLPLALRTRNKSVKIAKILTPKLDADPDMVVDLSKVKKEQVDVESEAIPNTSFPPPNTNYEAEDEENPILLKEFRNLEIENKVRRIKKEPVFISNEEPCEMEQDVASNEMLLRPHIPSEKEVSEEELIVEANVDNDLNLDHIPLMNYLPEAGASPLVQGPTTEHEKKTMVEPLSSTCYSQSTRRPTLHRIKKSCKKTHRRPTRVQVDTPKDNIPRSTKVTISDETLKYMKIRKDADKLFPNSKLFDNKLEVFHFEDKDDKVFLHDDSGNRMLGMAFYGNPENRGYPSPSFMKKYGRFIRK